MISTSHSSLPSTPSAFVGTPDEVPGPRDLAALQRDTLALMAKAPAIFIVLPALVFLPFDFVNEVVTTAMGGDDAMSALRAMRAYHRFAQWIELGVGSLVAATVLLAAVSIGEGRTPTMVEALKAGSAAWGRTVKTTFITGILVGLSFLLFIVPSFVFGTRFMLAVPATVIDGLDGKEARAKSTEIVRARGTFRLFLWAFAACFSWYMLSMVPGAVTSTLLSDVDVPLVLSLINAVTAAAWNIVGAGLVVAAGLLYLEGTGRTLRWPVGRALRDSNGGRIAGPKGSGQAGIAIVGVLAGICAMILIPLIAIGVWFLVDADAASAFVDGSPAVNALFEALYGAEEVLLESTDSAVAPSSGLPS